MKLSLTCAVALVAAIVFAAAPASALNITSAGVIVDNANNEATEFFTQTTPKSLSADRDNQYGTDGFDLFGLQVNHTAYNTFAGIGPGIAIVGPFGGYAVIDNPNNPDAQVRTTTNGVGGPGSKEAVITYRITDASLIPNGFRIGIFTDALDGAQFSSQGLYVEQTAGVGPFGSAFVDLNPFRNNTIDMVFFDLTNAQTGDEYTLSVDSSVGGHATLQGVVFDSIVVPEPATLALIGLGMIGMGTRRRRLA